MTAPIPGAVCTCQFGVRGPWAAGYHTGRDYRAHTPVPVRATAPGVVVHAGRGGWGADYGIHVIIDTHGVRTIYAHLSATSVRPGAGVTGGQRVGTSGNTGNTTGPHLHYEERVWPYLYMNHRRPLFDISTALPVIDVPALQVATRRHRPVAHGTLFKVELRAALRAAGIKPARMVTGSATMGRGARANIAKLQQHWYGQGRGIPGARITRRLGLRRHKFTTRA